MFVIVYNNSVILGPMRWNRFRFENEIKEECDFSAVLPDRNDELTPIVVSDNIKVLPVQGTPDPEYNPKIQFLHGPFWEFTDSAAICSYQVQDYGVEAVKNFLKEQIEQNRWAREVGGCTIAINGVEHKFATDRNTRNILQAHIASGIASVAWKFDRDTWVNFSQQDLQNLLTGIMNHVQGSFDWELSKFSEIDQCQTLQELHDVALAHPDTVTQDE